MTELEIVFKETDYESHVSHALACKTNIENSLWELAAVCASLERNWGEKIIPSFAHDVGMSGRRIYQLIATHNYWLGKEINESLSFKHHELAAKSPDPEGLLEEAFTEQLSTRQLEERIKEVKHEELEQEFGGTIEVISRTCPTCNGAGEIPMDDKEN